MINVLNWVAGEKKCSCQQHNANVHTSGKFPAWLQVLMTCKVTPVSNCGCNIAWSVIFNPFAKQPIQSGKSIELEEKKFCSNTSVISFFCHWKKKERKNCLKCSLQPELIIGNLFHAVYIIRIGWRLAFEESWKYLGREEKEQQNGLKNVIFNAFPWLRVLMDCRPLLMNSIRIERSVFSWKLFINLKDTWNRSRGNWANKPSAAELTF